MENTITVTIPCQEFNLAKYLKRKDCYLHNALIALGFENVSVGNFGITIIENIVYIPLELFHWGTVEKAFTKGKNITVTLIKQ